MPVEKTSCVRKMILEDVKKKEEMFNNYQIGNVSVLKINFLLTKK